MKEMKKEAHMLEDKNIRLFKHHIQQIHEIAYKEFGVSNPLDKSKWREMIVAEELGHKLFLNASGGKSNDETYGADARNVESGKKSEYKTATMTKAHYEKFKKGTLKKQYSLVYNGAYDHEIIDRYEEIDHYLILFYGGENVCTVKVPVEYVIETLRRNLDAKDARRAGGETVTTNCNSVTVPFIGSIPQVGEII